MVTVQHGFINANGLRLHYLDYGGTGRPIICTHGVTGHAWVWRDVAPHLTDYGRVIALDFRGYGDSQWSAAKAYTTDDHVEDLGELVNSLTDGEVDLIGLSWGALVALTFAHQNPNRVRRLAMVDMPPSQEGSETDIPGFSGEFDTPEAVIEAERGASPFATDDLIEMLAAVSTRPIEGGRFARKHDPYFLEVWPFKSDDRWSEARSLDAPTLIAHGEKSYIWSLEEAHDLADQMKSATVVDIPASLHLIPTDNPEALARALVDFLSPETD